MTCPGTYPTVLNGQIYYNDSSTVEYECLSGFYMTGNKRITCTTGTWQTAPTCSVIRQYDDVDVYPDWWLIALAVLLGLIVLACFLCLILYFCCCRGDNTVHPYRGYNSGVCCGGGCGCGRCCECCEPRRTRPMDVDEDGGGVYYVPVNSTPIQTRSDGDLNEQPFKPKKPASKPPGWMPHSHPMRNINTSTK